MTLGETERLAVRQSSSRSSSPLERRMSHEGGRAECRQGQEGGRQCAMASQGRSSILPSENCRRTILEIDLESLLERRIC
jgi:hypothetical protein